MNEIKGIIGAEVKEHPNLAKAYGMLNQRMNGMAEETGRRIGDPNLLAKYMADKRDYRMASLLEPALTYSEAKNLIGGPAGHNTLRGVLGQVAEALTGLPPVGQVARNVMAKSAPVVKGIGKFGSKVGQVAAPVVRGLDSVAAQELTNALESRFGKRKP